jgi:hypothetical protein
MQDWGTQSLVNNWSPLDSSRRLKLMEPGRCTSLRFARKLGQLVLAHGVFHFSCMNRWFPLQDKRQPCQRQLRKPLSGLSHVGSDVDTFGGRPALSKGHVNQQTGKSCRP